MKRNLATYQQGYIHWDVHCSEQHWRDLFRDPATGALNPDIIYLSGDSAEPVPDCAEIQSANRHIFVIGGLIDHNRHPGMALARAKQDGVRHGQLPISDHVRLCQRRVLSIPHVFEIMLLAANGTLGAGGWEAAFGRVIPARKIQSTPVENDGDQ